jgi:hypothetical protein
MKKATRRKLVLGRDVVAVLVTELRGADLQAARGGVGTSYLDTCWTYKSLQECSSTCSTIDK